MNISPSEAPALLHSTLQRLAAQSASCKLWSVVLTSLVLAMAAGRAGAEVLVWAAAPSLLLALADAAYKVQAARVTALAAKDTVRVEDLFRLQSGNAGLAASIQTLRGLASFSVWPFYATLATVVVVLGQTVLVPQNKAQLGPQNPSINAGPFPLGVPRPAYTILQNPSAMPPGTVVYSGASNVPPPASFTPSNGPQSFTPPPPNQVTVSRPNMPPMGVPSSKPTSKPATAPGAPPRPAPTANPPGATPATHSSKTSAPPQDTSPQSSEQTPPVK